MTIEELIKKYAKEHGYTGLYNSEGECGCSFDDPFPCGALNEDCEFGYVTKCKNCDVKDSEEGCRLNKEGSEMCVRT